MLIRRLLLYILLFCLGCAAQTLTPDTRARIEQHVRAAFNLPPDVNVMVGDPHTSDFPKYDALTVTLTRESKSQKFDFLLSKDNNTLIRISKIDLTKDLYAETMKQIDVQGRPVRGNPNAKVTIVNFDDYECPFCSRLHSTLMTQILPQYGDRVKIIYKDFPLPMHPWAPHAANDANCLAKENSDAYWQLADYLHANQRSIGAGDLTKASAELDRVTLDFGKKHGADETRLQACMKAQPDSVLKASMAEGDALGISATPTLFINGERVEGAIDANELRAAIDERLRAAGVDPPEPGPPNNAVVVK